MDDFKKKTMSEYTSWDMDCKYLCPTQKCQAKLKKIFRRKARRNLKIRKGNYNE